MIKPNELRIGNWVHHNEFWSYRNENLGDGFDFQIEQRDFYADYECTIDFDITIEPIPLTEEWLLKFRFSQLVIGKALTDEFEKDSMILAMPTNEGAGFQVCIEKKHINLNIVWVHQLQNLYFALTGEELTIE